MTRNHLSEHHQATQEIHGHRPLGPCTWILAETTLSSGRGGLSFSHPRLRGGGAVQEQRPPFQDGGHPGGSDGAVDAMSARVLGGHHSGVSGRPGRGPRWRRVKKAVPSQRGWASANPSGPEQNRRRREGRSAVCPAGSPALPHSDVSTPGSQASHSGQERPAFPGVQLTGTGGRTGPPP